MFIAGENKRVFLRMDYHTRKKTLKKGKRKKEKGLFLLQYSTEPRHRRLFYFIFSKYIWDIYRCI